MSLQYVTRKLKTQSLGEDNDDERDGNSADAAANAADAAAEDRRGEEDFEDEDDFDERDPIDDEERAVSQSSMSGMKLIGQSPRVQLFKKKTLLRKYHTVYAVQCLYFLHPYFLDTITTAKYYFLPVVNSDPLLFQMSSAEEPRDDSGTESDDEMEEECGGADGGEGGTRRRKRSGRIIKGRKRREYQESGE